MRLARTALSVLPWLVLACAEEAGDDTGVADDSTTALTAVTEATASSTGDGGAESSTGNVLECDANVEIALADGVELGAMSVEAVRHELGGDVQYEVKILGDAAGTSELDIVFWGEPSVGIEYSATALMQLNEPVVALLPPTQGELDFQTGTVTYTIVGTAEGDELAFHFELEFLRGTIDGCVHTQISIDAG